jgi:WD40 repeat protein
VRRLDRAPFIFGQQINALALDTAGRRLAVVGERLGQIVDATTGDTIVALSLEYAWANDCAFSPDGSALAVAYHGCHVVIFDAATGQRLRTMDGFGGVPDATRRLAFAPDGELLGFAGSDGSARLVRWRTGEEVWHTAPRTGSFEAITFSEEGTCLFSHVKVRGGEKNSLLRVDLATLGSTTIDMPSSMWSLARAGGRWYAGGDGKKIRPLGRELRPARTGALEHVRGRPPRPRPRRHPARRLAGRRAPPLEHHRQHLATVLLADAGKLWALAVAPDGTIYTAGAAGIVHRFTREGVEIRGEHGEVHTKQITSIVPLPDGTTLTSAWDGRLLRWPVGLRHRQLPSTTTTSA